jgi:choice-of-anchor B domain-containing protein
MKYRNHQFLTLVLISLLTVFNCKNDDDQQPSPSQNQIVALFPCENGMAGEYPCNGIDIISYMDTATLSGGSGANGSDVWGWTDPTTNKEYALIGMTNTTAFVDISDPSNPINLGRLNTAQGAAPWRDIKVYNNHAFIVADGQSTNANHGMQVFDLTRLRNVANPPEDFTADFRYTGVGKCHNIVINESEAVAYLVGCNTTNNGGPIFLDISNPTNPVSLGDYTLAGYSHDAQVITYNGPDSDYQGREIYIGSNGNNNTVAILDVTDKSNVVTISQFTYPQTSYAHQGWFTEDQRFFILGDETDETSFGFNTKTIIFDFTDLDNPILSSNYFGSTAAIDHNGYVLGNEYYLANYRAGMRILNIDNISAASDPMTETHYIDTYPEDDSANYNGVWSIYPYFQSGNIVIGDIERGMFIVRKQ